MIKQKPNYVVDRAGTVFTVGVGDIHGKPADLSHDDHRAIVAEERRRGMGIPLDHLRAVLSVMRCFRGAEVLDDRV